MVIVDLFYQSQRHISGVHGAVEAVVSQQQLRRADEKLHAAVDNGFSHIICTLLARNVPHRVEDIG